ncbi:hypothetical protein HW555_011559 [Spodoptera exigua]|uniref:Uncharacterized protein n=1 Tax=Spodoptera exigua TaxID=7107 RepID=A0A835L4H8_SPOEX|nr:hypothetical protein HW555_011559 [Spodoptera exigua]
MRSYTDLIYQKITHKKFISDVTIPNKLVIVTGANTGIGYETAKELSRRGAKVILACRDMNKAQKAATEIQLFSGNKVIAKYLDLASFRSITEFAKGIIETERRVDILINNAGTGVLDNSLTEDNLPIEAQFGTVDELDKQANTFFGRRRVYANTKLANVLFTRKLAEEVRRNNVIVNCLHPGAVDTEIFRNQPKLIRFLLKLLFLTPEEGAQTSIFLAVSDYFDERIMTGKYFSNCTEESPSDRALDPKAAQKLWDLSLKICFKEANVVESDSWLNQPAFGDEHDLKILS